MAVFQKEDNWTDFATNGPNGEVNIFDIKQYITEEVGANDLADYYKLDLTSATNLVLSIDSTDAIKVTIYTLISKVDKNGNLTYSKKALQSTNVKKNKAGYFEIDTKNLLLEKNTYYLGVEPANKKTQNAITYNIKLDPNKNTFYTLGNNDDDWNDFKSNGNSSIKGNMITVNDKTTQISIDENWVGFGDSVDYKMISLDNAGQLSFSVTGSDAAKFVIYSLSYKEDKNGNRTYSKKAIQSSALKKLANNSYAIDTKNLLLDKGEYYLAIESTNAKKGGNCLYDISLNQDKSFFYTLGNNSDDNFVTPSSFETITNTKNCYITTENWVGLGDVIDYFKFNVSTDMEVGFSIDSTDAVKFTVYELIDGKLKQIQSPTSIKANTYTLSKSFSLSKGEYYFSIESTNAKKGGNANYQVSAFKYLTSVNYTVNDETNDDVLQELTNNNDKIILDNFFLYNNSEDYSIDFKGGNDQLILKNFSYIEIDNLYMNDGSDIVTLDKDTCFKIMDSMSLGSGNDKVLINTNSVLSSNSNIDFDSGNDTLEFKKEAYLYSTNLNMNDGNDTVKLASISKIYTTNLNLGDGDDSLLVDKDAIVSCSNLSFGKGSDKLVLNGKVIINENIDLGNLESISGKGTLFLSEEAASSTDLTIVKNANIEIIVVKNTNSVFEFTNTKTELVDNTPKKAQVLNAKNMYFSEFWLSGETAVNSEYAFVDDTDYFKFVMTDDINNLTIDFYYEDQGSCSVNYDIFDKNNNSVLSGTSNNDSDINLSSLASGATYYIKLTVDSDKVATGYLCLSEI